MRYQFTATMSNIVPQHSITEKRQLGPTSHAEIHNSISNSVRQYRDNNCDVSPEPAAAAGHKARAIVTKHKHFLATNKTSEKRRTFLTSII